MRNRAARSSSSCSCFVPPTKGSLMAPKRKAPADKEAPAEDSKKTKVSALKVGDLVPDASLENEEGETLNLREAVKDSGAVIFMYPKANTGGCTKQACGFKDKYADIKKAGFTVFGLSFDKPKSQKNWKTKYELPYHLLTDTTGEVIKAFGAAKGDKKVSRSHVVVGKGGKILDVRNGISPGDSFAEALKTVSEAGKAQ